MILKETSMKGRFMITEVVNTAHVFCVVRDCSSGIEYGLHFELSNPNISIETFSDQRHPNFNLDGVVMLKETVELAALDKMLNE